MLTAPPHLQPGDKIAIVAPGKAADADSIELATKVFRSWGLEVAQGKNLFNKHFQFSATDYERYIDLQEALDNTTLKAIICARGGYGTTRIVDQLDLSLFAKHPKWVVGFSDITVLLAKLSNAGFQAIHGIMPAMFASAGNQESLESLKKLLFGEPVGYKCNLHPLNRSGKAEGIITGGTLSLLCNSLGTPTETDTYNKILFLEDVGEYLYALDRMMIQLKRAGKLATLAGLIIGRFAGTKDTKENPFGKTIEEIVAEAVAEYNYPVCYNFPVGHIAENMAIPCGSVVRLEVNEKGSTLTFANTEPSADII
jgi:muramoyltetrapeptide carboxypeptidase